MAMDYYTAITGAPLCSVCSEVTYREQRKGWVSKVCYVLLSLGTLTNLHIISTARHPSVERGHGATTDKGKKDHQHKNVSAKQEMKQDQEAGKP